MKTKILTIIAFLAVVVFNATAQQTTILMDNASYGVAATFSSDGGKLSVAKDLYTDPTTNIDNLGLVKTFNIGTTVTPENEYVLQKGAGGPDPMVLIYPGSLTISNNGDVYVFYRKDAYGGNTYNSLNKNGVVVGNYSNREVRYIQSNNNSLYMLLGFGGNGTQAEFTKINASNSVEWTVNQSGDLGKKILLNEGNPFVQMEGGNLIEYNSSNGSFVSTTTTDDPNDVFQLSTADFVEKLDISDKKLYSVSGITEWEYRFFNDYPSTIWKQIDDHTYGISGRKLFVFDSDMEDMYKVYVCSFASNEEMLTIYIYDDKSVSYITRIGGTVYHKHYAFPEVAIPSINSSATNVISAHDGKILVGSDWVDSNTFVSTVVMNDGDLPSENEETDTNLVIPPSGYTLSMGAVTPTLNADGYAEYIFNNNLSYIRLRLYFVGTSALDIEDNTVSSKIIASPNPCNNSIKISNICEMDEISVFDNIGQLVFRKELIGNPNNYLIDFSNFKSGVYVIQLKNKNGIYYKKIIKK